MRNRKSFINTNCSLVINWTLHSQVFQSNDTVSNNSCKHKARLLGLFWKLTFWIFCFYQQTCFCFLPFLWLGYLKQKYYIYYIISGIKIWPCICFFVLFFLIDLMSSIFNKYIFYLERWIPCAFNKLLEFLRKISRPTYRLQDIELFQASRLKMRVGNKRY